MSSVSFMEKLLDGVNVEWKALGELVNTVTAPSKLKRDAYCESGMLPIIDQGIEFIAGFTDEDISPVESGDYVVFGDHSEHIKYVDFSFVQGADGLKILKAVSDNPKYIYHAFQNFYRKELNYKRHWSSARETLLPIPCPENPKKSLEIQAEIVRILDTFTELTSELTSELTARRKQYNYYRDKLLTFHEGEAEWKTLGEITLPSSNIRWRDANRTYRYIDLTSVSRENNKIVETSEISANNAPSRAQKLVEKDDVIFATTRPTQLRISLIDEEYSGEVASTGYCVLRAKTTEVLPRWIYYHLSSTEFGNYVEENQSGSAYPAISDSKVKEFKLPIPLASDPKKSLAEQTRIVAILDKFDALTNSITEGLPREIELRQKQYEYYRDLLLSFPKPEVKAA